MPRPLLLAPVMLALSCAISAAGTPDAPAVAEASGESTCPPPASATSVGCDKAGGAAAASGPQRFREDVEVVGEPTAAGVPAELPVRPADVMAVAGTADNVFRTLQTLPGIAATSEFDSRISVRGGAPDENLTLMDGVEIHNPYRLFGLTSAFNPETVRRFDLYAGAFSAKYGDRLSSLLIVENRPGSETSRLKGSAALSLTDANVVLEGRLPGEASGSWIVTGRRTYYDLVANSIVGTQLPAFGDLQARLDWKPWAGGSLSFVALRSREATDASFTGDRSGEQGAFVSSARNDLAALTLKTLIGSRGVSRTTASYYTDTDGLGADAQFRSESRRSNAPDDAVGFRLADVSFTRDLDVRDLALRQELALQAGAHLLEAGFEAHQLRTGTAWQIAGDRNNSAANGSSIRGGAGLPASLDSSVDGSRVGAWLQDRWQPTTALAIEAGLRVDRSSVNQRHTVSPRLSSTLRLGPATRLRAGFGRFTQSPGYEKLIQSDYFVDLSGDRARSLDFERATHAVLGLERDVAPGLSTRVEAYWKGFDELVIGRLESDAEREARLARYDFPAELASSIPADPIITTIPVNGGRGQSWGVDVLVQKRPTPGARISGWLSYTYGVARREEYGRTLPFEYDRRHAATLVGSWRLSARWEVAATVRAFSGFPRTPVLGLRVAADETADGRLVPALDAEGRYVYETTSGGVSSLNSARLPAFVRLDLRLSWKPRGDAGRWLVYLDVINATNRSNAGQIDARLEYDPESALGQPRLVEQRAAAVPLLPSLGVRFRF